MCPNNPNVARSSSFADSTRDGDPARYGGMGCLKAAANISGDLGKALIGMNPADQRAIDIKLLSMDTVREHARGGEIPRAALVTYVMDF